jgi:hypothetical protein
MIGAGKVFGYMIGIKPIGSNHAYATDRSGRRYMTGEAKKYKRELTKAMAFADLKRGKPRFGSDATIELTIACLYPATAEEGGLSSMYTLAGKLRKRDATGPLKLTEDAISEYLGIDDSYNLSVHIHKRSRKEIGCAIAIAISEIEDGAPVLHAGRRIV